MTKPPPVSDPMVLPLHQADLLLFRLYRIHSTAGPAVVRLCEAHGGLTRREWRVLSFVAENEGVLSSELASRALLDRARTSRTLTGLTEKGLIAREPRPSNRREVQIRLTDSGRAQYERLFPDIAAANVSLVSGLTQAEREQLHHLVGKLQSAADRLAGSAMPRVPGVDESDWSA